MPLTRHAYCIEIRQYNASRKGVTIGYFGKAVAGAGNFTIAYGESLLKDVESETFARKPVVNGKAIDCNHPAWVYGHLAMYPGRACELLGIPAGPAAPPAGWDVLFKNGTKCEDDASGTMYPKMETIVSHYMNSYKYLLSKLPEVDDAVFQKPNPAGGRMTELFPTIGGAIVFMVSGHPMSHLGQASTWRRCMGLGSAM